MYNGREREETIHITEKRIFSEITHLILSKGIWRENAVAESPIL